MENEAVNFVRRLIPFPGTESLPLASPLRSAGGSTALQDQVGKVVTPNAVQQASAIVSQAASILDEEMARGVVAASKAGPYAPAPAAGAGNPLLHQVHEVINQIAAALPGLAESQRREAPSYGPAASDVDPPAELRPTTVKAGERGMISMTLCNSESRPVRLVSAATDLLGSRSGSIPCSVLEFTPSELKLDPQEKMDVAIALTVPAGTAPGWYSGLFVARGVDYLRALITIEVI